MIAVLALLAWAQINQPPEFSTTTGGFRKSEVDTAIDSAAHTSGQKSASAKWMVRSLGEWPRQLSHDENTAWQHALETLGTGALSAAEKEFATAARQFPGSPRLAAGQATAIYAQGAYDRAAAVLLAAATRHPSELRFIRYLSEVEDAHAGVLPQLKRYATAYPQSADAQYAYGLALLRTSPAAGERYLKSLWKLTPPDARAHLALAKLSTGQPAIAYLKMAEKLEPENAEVHYRLAQAYAEAGDATHAAQHRERYKALKR